MFRCTEDEIHAEWLRASSRLFAACIGGGAPGAESELPGTPRRNVWFRVLYELDRPAAGEFTIVRNTTHSRQ
jgi:hypothetical protein